jgi:hypothetical protein
VRIIVLTTGIQVDFELGLKLSQGSDYAAAVILSDGQLLGLSARRSSASQKAQGKNEKEESSQAAECEHLEKRVGAERERV